MNLVVLKGNLTRDPELRHVQSGGKDVSVVNFTLAVNRYFKRGDGTKDKETTFLDCEAWDSGAETIGEIFSRGDPMLIAEGSLKVDSWKNDAGENRSRVKIRVNKFEKLYRSSNTNSESQGTDTSEAPLSEPVVAGAGSGGSNPEDDIPF